MFRSYVFGHSKSNLSPGLESALVAHWKLDGNSNDASGNGNNGTDTAVSYTGGKINNAASFNGTTSIITVPDNDAFSLNGGSPDKELSISLWDFWSYENTVRGYMSKGKADADTTNEWDFFIWAETIYFRIRDKTTNGVYLGVQANLTYPVSGWKHIVLTYTGIGALSGFKIYEDNVLLTNINAGSGTYTGAKNTTRPVTIGGLFDNYYFNRKLDEIRIFNKAITATEVAELWNGGIGK